jgi:hypothetical protein
MEQSSGGQFTTAVPIVRNYYVYCTCVESIFGGGGGGSGGVVAVKQEGECIKSKNS